MQVVGFSSAGKCAVRAKSVLTWCFRFTTHRYSVVGQPLHVSP